jgi:hypothetical protein
MADAPELKPCPFCGDKMQWNHGGGYASHQGYIKPCPIRNQGFIDVARWNTRADLARAAEADAFAAGVKAGLLAAAEAYATHRLIWLARYAPMGWRHTIYNDLCALAADPDVVARIAAIAACGQPTEYDRKVAQMKKDFPGGI